jgi:hypothetical protein
MWFHSTPGNNVAIRNYTAVYPEMAIERLQDGLVSAISALSGNRVHVSEAQETKLILISFLNDIRKSKFLPVGFSDKITDLINKELNPPKEQDEQ